jgi:CheY-like chemotaxis protein
MIEASVMVVEDEGITAIDIESRLTRLGYRVTAVASSGAQAIDKALKTHPDIVLMDIRLKGGMDGVEAAAEIHARFGIPVTYLTAYADDETLTRAQSTVPYGYLVKPFAERELHATIQMALYRHRIEEQVKEANKMLESVNESLLELSPTEERIVRTRFGIGVRSQRLGGDGGHASKASTSVPPETTERVATRTITKLRNLSVSNSGT